MSLTIPSFCRVQRRLPSTTPVEISSRLANEWQQLALADQVRGKNIALGIGSRGLANIQQIAIELVRLIRDSGGTPFIVPAMGSHGGATAAGQVAVLAGLGITEDTIGCAIKATMDTVLIGHTLNGHPAYFDRHAAAADGVMLVNRVKPHTDFHDTHESGLLKMLAIGLGKEDGARFMHSQGTKSLRAYMPEVGAYLLERVNLIAGFATVEDGYHQVAQLEAFTPETLIAGEVRLLDHARQLMPRLPVDSVDLLIVDYLGKEISGTGMDTNVIGRVRIDGEPEPATPQVKALVVLDVTDASHGNALGVGLADFTVERLLNKIDFAQMTKNVFTSGFFERGRIPLVYKNDEAAILAAIEHVFRSDLTGAPDARIIRIRDTLSLEEIWVSANLLDEVRASSGFIAADSPKPLPFQNGCLF